MSASVTPSVVSGGVRYMAGRAWFAEGAEVMFSMHSSGFSAVGHLGPEQARAVAKLLTDAADECDARL